MDQTKLFTMIFSEKKEALDLYNAITKRSYTNAEELSVVMLGNVICMSMKKDTSLIVTERSTLRNLKTLFPLLMNLHSEKGKGQKQIMFPIPNLIIMYHGISEMQDYKAQSIKDSILFGEESISVETKAHVININRGHNDTLLNCCESLRDYSEYVYRVRLYQKTMSIEAAVNRAVAECIQEGILEDFLKKHEEVVKTISKAEFDQQKRIEVEKNERYLDGVEQGRLEGAQNMLRELVGKKLIQGVPIEEISDMLEISIPKICSLIEEIYGIESE